ncbi:Glyoxysomal processing protease, glyoxysomal-like protein [Drosera capensis]
MTTAAPTMVAAFYKLNQFTLVDVPGSSFPILSLIGPSSGTSEQSWEVGWSLATCIDDPQKFVDSVKDRVSKVYLVKSILNLFCQGKDKYPTQSVKHLPMTRSVSPYLISKTASRIVLLKGLPKIMISPSNRRGDVLLAMGSPFGILSPVRFFNSIVVGCISNKYPPTSSDGSLLLADIRCLPGMEGGPIFGEARYLIGLLIRPLKQAGGAEIQLVITWQAIAAALYGRCYDMRPEKASHCANANCDNLMSIEINSPFQGSLPHYIHRQSMDSGALESPIWKAAAAVCLVTMDNGVWASGILLNNHDLILTNAHINLHSVNSAGHMVGLVTSNAKHGRGTVIPHMNFSIPCAALEPVFKFSEDMEKLSILEELDRPYENLSSVWALMPPLSPPPKHGWHNVVMKEDDEKQEKGSLFTKFIADRPELFKGLGQQPKMAGSLFLDHRTPSKL